MKTKYQTLPFWSPKNWEGFEGRLFHLSCSGEISFTRKKNRYALTGTCDRCGESFKCDMRTLKRQFGFATDKRSKTTRAALVKELRERPIYPEANVNIEDFDYSDTPVTVKFFNGAMMTRNPNQGPPPILGVWVSGKFHHVKQKPPKELKVIKYGLRGRKTRP